MPKTIERVRYFDGEFLRSDDLSAEQLYHIQMRRLLNLRLHLYGVAYGVQLEESPDAANAGLSIFHVTPGMAIDPLGREIVVQYAQVIDNMLIIRNKIQNAGQYRVWLCYREKTATPPPGGLQLCNLDDQMTRWLEEFDIVLVDKNQSLASDPINRPSAGLAGVPLGVVHIDATLTAVAVTKEGRDDYVGINAQRVTLPEMDLDEAKFRDASEPPSPRSWLNVAPNIAARANEAVGENYGLPDADFNTAPAQPDIPDAGNLKLAGSLFVKSKYYQWDTGINKWLTLDELLTRKMKGLLPTLVPDVQAGSEQVSVTNSVAAADKMARGTHTFQISSPIQNLDGTASKLVVSLRSATLHGKTDLTNWYGDITATVKINFDVDNTQIAGAGVPGTYNCSFDWVAGPFRNSNAGDLYIESFAVSWVAVLKPTV